MRSKYIIERKQRILDNKKAISILLLLSALVDLPSSYFYESPLNFVYHGVSFLLFCFTLIPLWWRRSAPRQLTAAVLVTFHLVWFSIYQTYRLYAFSAATSEPVKEDPTAIDIE